MDQRQVEESLEKEGRKLNTLITEYEEMHTALAIAETEYKRVFAQKTVQLAEIKMTADLRKAQVDLDTIEEYYTYKMCQVAYNVVKEKISSTKSRLDALRTLSAANRIIT
jgi:hypothetical protein